jgi:solute carrier family 25 protein 33/36
MPYPGTVSPGEGESSAVNPVLPSRIATTGSDSQLQGAKLVEWQRRAAVDLDAGAQVDLQVEEMRAKGRGEDVKGKIVPQKGWLHFVAGGVGGMCGAIVTSPLDVVKTRLQSDMFKSQASKYATQPGFVAGVKRLAYHFVETGHILRTIAIKESPRALFKGLGPTLAGVIPARSINFYTYGNGKLVFAEHLTGGKESPAIHLLSAACAGIVTATATNPIWVIKTRLQLDSHAIERAVEASRQAAVQKAGASSGRTPSKASLSTWSKSGMASHASSLGSTSKGGAPAFTKYFKPSPSPSRPTTNSFQMALKIVKSEGIAGLYKGMSASYLGVAEGTIQWTLYERLKRKPSSPFDSIQDKPESRLRQWTGTVGAAGTAKMIASLITYPHEVCSLISLWRMCVYETLFAHILSSPSIQVIRTRLRQEPPHGQPQRYTGLVQTIRLVLREEGLVAMYGGLSAHLLRVVPVSMGDVSQA